MIHTEGKFAFCAGVLGPGAACLLSGVISLEEEHSKIFFNLSEKRSNYINRFCMYFCSNNLKVVGKKTESSEIFASSPENGKYSSTSAESRCSGHNVQLTLGNLIKMVSPGHY